MYTYKPDDVYKDIAEDVETRFDTSRYELDKPLPKGKNKKVIGLMKGGLGGKIMTKFVGLRTKTYSYLIDDGSKDFKNCLKPIYNKINYLEKNETNVDSLKKGHKEFIKINELILKTLQRFKSERRNVFTEEIN